MKSPIFQKNADDGKPAEPHDGIEDRPDPPPWRRFNEEARMERGAKFHASDEVVQLVNAALFLRRPLLVTGKPGTGKSSLAFAVAYQLKLGKVLHWGITTRSTLQQGLYSYDALARLQDSSLAASSGQGNDKPQVKPASRKIQTRANFAADPKSIGSYIRLGPLGTAILGGAASRKPAKEPLPRVLLIDEIDKSDIDLPNDLLNIFEEGEFEIPELSRLPKREEFEKIPVPLHDTEQTVDIRRGRVPCKSFPFVVMTSNGEREFPPAFLRRCLRLDIKPPTPEELVDIVNDRLSLTPDDKNRWEALTAEFLRRRDTEKQEVATDQLLNAVYLVMNGVDPMKEETLKRAIFRSLSELQ